MDGYRIASGGAHVASLKGVIADEVRFESGLTRLTMGVQARCERLHVHRAARVLVTSRYSGESAQRLYGLGQAPTVVPELIDLAAWRRHLAAISGARACGALHGAVCGAILPPEARRPAAGSSGATAPVDSQSGSPHRRQWTLQRCLACAGRAPAAGETRSPGWAMFRAPSWPRNTIAATSSACRAFRRASASCCWRPWLPVSRLWRRARRRFRKWRRTRLWWNRRARRRWRQASSRCRVLPAGRVRQREKGLVWVEQFDAPRVAGLFVEAVRGVTGR